MKLRSIMITCCLVTSFILQAEENLNNGETLNGETLKETDAPWAYPNFYPAPGVRALRGGKWLGSDHLFNLVPNLGVVVEIIKPPKFEGQLDSEQQFEERVKALLMKSQIKSAPEAKSDKPALPFLHVLMLIYPVKEGYVAYCAVRLFEEVSMDRVVPAKGTVLQGITWEKQTLIFTPKDSMNAQINRTIEDLVNTFNERYKFFETIKARS